MATITTDQLLILLGYAGAIIGIYVAMNVRIKALEIEIRQIQKEQDNTRADSQKFDERVTKKFDAIMIRMDEKFEVVNEKMNELIREFTKH